jgi:hypothetical protein
MIQTKYETDIILSQYGYTRLEISYLYKTATGSMPIMENLRYQYSWSGLCASLPVLEPNEFGLINQIVLRGDEVFIFGDNYTLIQVDQTLNVKGLPFIDCARSTGSFVTFAVFKYV